MEKSYDCPVCSAPKKKAIVATNADGHMTSRIARADEALAEGEQVAEVWCGACGLMFHDQSV